MKEETNKKGRQIYVLTKKDGNNVQKNKRNVES
jgi:hypothetical protein